jgi:hypothetical protein
MFNFFSYLITSQYLFIIFTQIKQYKHNHLSYVILIEHRPHGKESTEVRITQNKGKEFQQELKERW